MKTISVLLFVGALWLAVLFGGQTEAWSWGPAFLALSLSIAFGLAGKSRVAGSRALWCALLLAVGWIVVRCFSSPVLDFARADFMLALGLLAAAWVGAGIDPGGREIKVLYLGIAASVLANVVMACLQVRQPEIMWPYAWRPSMRPTGFFSHYNYFSNYMVGASMLLAGRIIFSKDKRWLRVTLGVAVLGAIIVVPISGSRGGVLALAVGMIVLLMGVGIVAHRTKRKWFPLVAIAVPLLVIGAISGGVILMNRVQEDRGQREGLVSMADNTSRLSWMQLALQVSGDHLAIGGGSRSFSWERNQKWSLEEFGYGYENEPFVHNELLQLMADYGVTGGLLTLGAIGVMGGLTVFGLFMGSSNREEEGIGDAVFVGVAAGSMSLLAQANFSFVFHMLPAVLLLGLFFGLTIAARGRARPVSNFGVWMRPGLGLVLSLVVGVLGWKAGNTLRLVWPILYASNPLQVQNSPAEIMDGLDEASKFWPGFRIPEEKGNQARVAAAQVSVGSADSIQWNLVASDAYQQAFEVHPFNPELAINLGNAYSDSGFADEAETVLEKAIVLQGGLETSFRARFFLARHLFSVWQQRWMKERRSGEALGQFLRARQLLREADEIVPWSVKIQASDLKVALKNSIDFLEGAGVKPVPAAD